MAPLARLSASFSSLDATSDCCPLAAMMTLAASSRPPSPAPFGRSSALFPPSPSSPSRPSSRAEHRRSTIDSRTPSPAKTLVRPSGLVVPSSASTTTSLLPSFAQGRFLPRPLPPPAAPDPCARVYRPAMPLVPLAQLGLIEVLPPVGLERRGARCNEVLRGACALAGAGAGERPGPEPEASRPAAAAATPSFFVARSAQAAAAALEWATGARPVEAVCVAAAEDRQWRWSPPGAPAVSSPHRAVVPPVAQLVFTVVVLLLPRPPQPAPGLAHRHSSQALAAPLPLQGRARLARPREHPALSHGDGALLARRAASHRPLQPARVPQSREARVSHDV